MVTIDKNEYGNLIINRNTLARIVMYEMNAMSFCIEFCNRKGKPLKKFIAPVDDIAKLNSIEIRGKNGIEIDIFCLIKNKYIAEKCLNELFDRIEEHYNRLSIEKPKLIRAYVRRVSGEHSSGDCTEVLRINE